ncbi:MAG TPA: 4-hydroxy-tetrahydrodipicolinate reductase, partial [Deltaproteobacteria bacterium]|nr:4-hydroxy-tetrahydrodipicolinate reductase [Deltaproteobacteria bacterium]
MVNAIVAGAAGRMGRRIIHMIYQNPETTLVGAFERPGHPDLHEDAGILAGVGELGVKIQESLEEVMAKGDVLIDFTAPEATLNNMRVCSSHGLSAVIGTTGISGKMLQELETLAKKTRCVFSPNMSVGVNVMFKIAGEMARILGDDYDMEILEVHHRLKKDAPSGTAMKLAGVLADAVG